MANPLPAFPALPAPPAPPPPRPVVLRNLGLSNQDLFPIAATHAEVSVWFGGQVPPNPITAALSDNSFDQQRAYVENRVGAAYGGPGGPLPDTQEFTVQRESHHYIVHQDDHQEFDQNNQATYRAVHQSVGINAQTIPNHGHWTYHYRQGNQGPNLTRTWHKSVQQLIRKTNADCRGAMVSRAKRVWQVLSPQPNSSWFTLPSAVAGSPDLLLRTMLFYIRDESPLETPAIVRFLLGDRMTHFDVDALYVAYRTGVQKFVPDTNVPPVYHDVVPFLVWWLELTCAYVLVECFRNYRVIDPATKDSVAAVRDNLRYLARRNPHRNILEAGIVVFPYK